MKFTIAQKYDQHEQMPQTKTARKGKPRLCETKISATKPETGLPTSALETGKHIMKAVPNQARCTNIQDRSLDKHHQPRKRRKLNVVLQHGPVISMKNITSTTSIILKQYPLFIKTDIQYHQRRSSHVSAGTSRSRLIRTVAPPPHTC